MKSLVIADVHSNLEALQAVLAKAKKIGYDRVLVCGDIVGYNANPKEVIDILKAENAICVRGNHDREAITNGAEFFNPVAKAAIQWTHKQLKGTPYFDWVAGLPKGPIEIQPGVRMCHGAVYDEDAYVGGWSSLKTGIYPLFTKTKKRPVVFFGHTHFPTMMTAGQEFGGDWLINPGSAGQPRDGNPKTAFAIWDDTNDWVHFYRIPYNYKLTQKKILDAGLPEYLAERLGK